MPNTHSAYNPELEAIRLRALIAAVRALFLAESDMRLVDPQHGVTLAEWAEEMVPDELPQPKQAIHH